MSGIFDQIINYSPPLIVSGTVNYKGTWNASANTPTLIDPPVASTKGDYYVVSTAGTQFSITFGVGDWIISNGTAWEKVDLTDAVSSVFGRTGAVVGVSTDYSSVGLTNTAIGASSPSTGAFTTVSATTPIAVASGGTGVSTSTGTTNVVLSGSPTIVTPVIAQINDASGNETLKLASIASAVNEVTIENAATGNPVHIRATGGDASVGLHLVAKGASGYVNVTDGVDETKRIMFNAAGGTTNTRTMLSSTQTVDRTISLPDATGTLLYGGGPLGTPSSGTVTNLTGTASININGTVGATTPTTGAFTTVSASGAVLTLGTNSGSGSSRRVFDIEAGGYASPGAFNTDSNGDKINLFKGGAGLSFDARIGVGTANNVWYRSSGSTSGAGVHEFYVGSTPTLIQSISSTGLAVTGALSNTNTITVSGTSATGVSSINLNASDFSSGPSFTTSILYQNGNSATGTSVGLSNAGLGSLYFQNVSNALIWTNSGVNMVFGTASTERMRINVTGLGVGTASPASKLHISGDANTRLQIDATTTQGIFFTKAGADNGTFRVDTNGNFEFYTKTVSQAMVLTAAGNVGIGVTAPGDKLEIGGSGSGIILASANGTRYRVTVTNLGVLNVAAV